MSINTTTLKSALKSLNLPIGKQVRYESIAKALNFVPKKIVKGKETKQALKVGSQKYKEAVYNELIRRKQQKGIVKKEQKVELIEKKEPKKKSKKLVESLMQKFFQKYSFEYDGIGNEEEFYNAVKSEVDAIGGDANFVTIYFKDLNAPKSKNIVGRNIGASYLDTFEEFMEEINKIKEGQYGSDPLDSSNYTPIYSDFKIATTAFNPTANGSSEDMMFKVKGIVSKEKLCVYESLLACGYKSTEYFVYPQQLRDINKLVWLIKEKNFPIAVIANAFTINKPSIDIINRDKTKITIKDKKRERMYVSGKVLQEDIDLVYICGDETAKHFIIYDEINQHADYCIGKPKLLDEVYLTFGNNIIMNEKIQFTCKEMRKMTKVDTGVPIEFVFFDYETIIDFNMSSCMKPYSLSILTLTSKQLDLLEEADFDKKEDVVKTIRGNCCKTFLGYDCNEKFIEWFLEYQLNKTLIFIGFNNTNFDNFLLLEGMLKYRDEHHMCELNVSDIFFNGSQLLNFKINGRHNTFDIRKHLMGSLKKNCKDFKINCCAKKEFNHDHAQELNDNDKLINNPN